MYNSLKTIFITTACALIFPSTLLADYSIVTPDTQKNITDSTGVKKPRISPQINITDILTPKPPTDKENPEVYFSADEVENNQELSIITANGNVEIIRDNLTVKADKVIYNQKEDTLSAVGNVIILESTGNVVFTDYAELSDKMTKADMKNIRIILADKTRISADTFRRGNKDKKIMTNAIYTPCDACEDSSPLWRIKARKVEHNAEDQDMHYQNATLELKGIPVFYTPFLSHPDPTVKRRSGFLFPRISSNKYLGGAIQGQYFWAISDQEDILFNPIISSDKGIIYSGGYNKYFTKGHVSGTGSFLRDPDTHKDRGNIFAYGRYEINDYWVADTDINYASDSAYLKDLSLPQKDDSWLTSRARLQGFDNRNYASLEAYYYKIISYNLRNTDAPIVFPLFSYDNISSPNKYGLYNQNTLSMASITHKEGDDSSQRISLINSWNLPYTSSFGAKYKFVASLKSDLYYVNDYIYNRKAPAYDGVVGRIFPQAGIEWRMPFIRTAENSHQIIEPIIVAALSPNQSNKIDEIPNEDSQDVELNDTNILNLNRYSGYDRNDVGSRISYGLNWSSYGKKWGRTSVLLAQSYEFEKDESFADADGQKGSFTDYVGRVYASPNEYFDLNYRFKIDKNDYKITYSELSSSIGPKILNLYLSYTFFQANNTSTFRRKEREELYTSIRALLTRNWSVSLYNRQDMTQGGAALEKGAFITYEDECTKIIFNIEKDNSNDPNYEDSFEFGATFFLKTLGGIGTN
ncbi:MAG: LPS-assembly protein LptD [Alphaproteobacteria bacterium]|nr:LPS-assembly protein LptD [Alphaproteobacteria bacterium]